MLEEIPIPYNPELAASDVEVPDVGAEQAGQQNEKGGERRFQEFLQDPHRALKAQILRAYFILVLSSIGAEAISLERNKTHDRNHNGDHSGNSEEEAQAFLKAHIVDRRYRHLASVLIDKNPWNGQNFVVLDNLKGFGGGGARERGVPREGRRETDALKPGAAGWPRFCNNADLLTEHISSDGGFAAHLLQSTVAEVVGQLEEIQASAGRARMEILLLNWLEYTSNLAVGPLFAAQLLHDVAAC